MKILKLTIVIFALFSVVVGCSSSAGPAIERVRKLQEAQFREAAAATVAHAYLSVASIYRYADINSQLLVDDGAQCQADLIELRRHAGVPPPRMKNREKIQSQLDDLVEIFKSATSTLECPQLREPVADLAQLMDAMKSLDGHSLPMESVTAFSRVCHAADAIVDTLELSFDESHATHLFCDFALAEIEHARLCVPRLLRLPTKPTVRHSNAIAYNVFIWWAKLVPPPKDLPNGPSLMHKLEVLYKEIQYADANLDCTYDARDALSDNDFDRLNKMRQEAFQRAIAICDEIEPQVRSLLKK